MTLDLEPRDRTRLLAVAILLAVFMAGIFGGATLFFLFKGERHVVQRERIALGPGPMMERTGIPGGDHGGVVFMRTEGPGFFGEELDLTDEQQERVDRLMEEQREKAERLMSEMEPRMKALMDSTNTAIEEVLTEEQRARFRELQERRRDVIARRFQIRVPEPPPAPPGE